MRVIIDDMIERKWLISFQFFYFQLFTRHYIPQFYSNYYYPKHLDVYYPKPTSSIIDFLITQFNFNLISFHKLFIADNTRYFTPFIDRPLYFHFIAHRLLTERFQDC